jgi:hypothetical protein
MLTVSRIGRCRDTQGIPVAGGICLPGKKGKGQRLSVKFDITEDLTMSLAGWPNNLESLGGIDAAQRWGHLISSD